MLLPESVAQQTGLVPSHPGSHWTEHRRPDTCRCSSGCRGREEGGRQRYGWLNMTRAQCCLISKRKWVKDGKIMKQWKRRVGETIWRNNEIKRRNKNKVISEHHPSLCFQLSLTHQTQTGFWNQTLMLALPFDPMCSYFVCFLCAYESVQSALVANSQVLNVCGFFCSVGGSLQHAGALWV